MRKPAVLAALACLLNVSSAFAQATPEDRAAADKLFSDAVTLAQSGNYEEACPKLEASQKLDPAIGTLMNLGICYEHLGRFASAWTSYNACGDLADHRGDKRAAEARQRARDLEPKLSMFTVEVQAESAAADLVVKRDDRPLDRGLWGVAVPLDPGEHVVEASAPGYEPWRTRVTVDKPGPFVVRVPKLARASAASSSAAAAPAGPLSGPASGPPEGAWPWGRTVALTAGGAGLVAVGVGAAFGIDTLGKTGAAKDHCFGGSPPRCDAEGRSLHAAAKETALAANIALIGGGALVAGGVVLWLVAPGSGSAAPAAKVGVAPAPGGLLLRGEW